MNLIETTLTYFQKLADQATYSGFLSSHATNFYLKIFRDCKDLEIWIDREDIF